MHRIFKLEVIAVLAAAIILAGVLIVKPIVGIADNGDFYRVMGPAGLDYLNRGNDNFFGYINREYIIKGNRAAGAGYFTTELALVRAAVLANKLFSSSTTFDIRFLCGLYIAVFLAALYLIVKNLKGRERVTDVLITALLIFVFTDIGYIAYFNSMYAEAVSLSFFLLTAGIALQLVRSDRPHVLVLAAFFLAAVMLVGAKVQNVPIALIVFLFSIRLWKLRRDALWKTVNTISLAFLMITAVVSYTSTSDDIRLCNKYHSVFYGILKDSSDPEKDLGELGLDDSLAVLAGTDFFMEKYPIDIKNPALLSQLDNKISQAKIALFYLRHPSRFVQKLEKTAECGFILRQGYGNYEKSDNVKYGKTADSFIYWSGFKVSRLPHSLFFVGLIYTAYFYVLAAKYFKAGSTRQRMLIELFMLIGLTGIIQFVIPVLGDGEADLARHLFLFNVCFDTILITIAAWVLDSFVKLQKRL